MISEPKSKPRREVRYAGWHGRRRLLKFGRFFRLPRLFQRRSRLQVCSPFVVERCADCPDDTKWMDRLALRFGGRYRILDRGSGGVPMLLRIAWPLRVPQLVLSSTSHKSVCNAAMQAPLLWRACRNQTIVLLSAGQMVDGLRWAVLSPVVYWTSQVIREAGSWYVMQVWLDVKGGEVGGSRSTSNYHASFRIDEFNRSQSTAHALRSGSS